MEKFKSKTGKDVRLASTSGHVVIVGEDFKEVPPMLEQKAMAAGLIPKSLYDEVKSDLKKELSNDEPAEAKKRKILEALQRIAAETEQGKEETAGGEKLVHNGKPVLAAVSEYAGFTVKTADIEDALT